MDVWSGSLRLDDSNEIRDIQISASVSNHTLQNDCTLQFLSHVDTSRIPLHMICGNRLDVWTANSETETWFSNLLLSSNDAEDRGQEWWQSATLESTLGVLAAVTHADASKVPQPRTTEILFYAARKNVQQDVLSPSHDEASSTDPELGLYALPLSSDLLLFNDTDITPPTSPVLGTSDPNTIDGRFIPRPWDEPTLRQRRKIALDSTFSAATDRRKRHSGASVAAAAAAQSNPSLLPSLPRLKSEASRGSVPLLTRPKSRSPSIASLRRDTTIPETKQRVASGLSRATPAPASSPQPSTEHEILQQKNKDMVSKVVLAGLRVWGFTASKRKKRASTSVATSETQQIAVDPEEEAKDEEYKLLYHHVYKAACFAFRAWIGKEDLSGKEYAEKVRDTVDALLEILCKDPTEQTRGEEMDLGEGFKGAVVRTPKGELGEEEKGLR
ncbi:hypothetical protein E4T50_02800 [Aureobasidium sp. EXF-12298]|nr:hypothetical protein E4T50_02800 [Aureobasidium sp. EXF-12298]KAI4754272.1 hypothetical protein E4T51_12598 [Aureobasidium sp. EXF-12344]KAI4771416.1 hypothetical protein E4T52_13580 [Aureobasidium sp. EXF-3400]